MITVTITTISISVVILISLPNIIVLIHTILINTIVAIIVTLVSNCIMSVIITATNNASISIPAPVLLLLLVRVPRSAQELSFYYHLFISTGAKQCTILRFARYPSATAKAWFSQCTYVFLI